MYGVPRKSSDVICSIHRTRANTMKKKLLLLIAVVGLAAYPAVAQTITVEGSSATVQPGDVFNVSISLSVSGLPACANGNPCNVSALNLLLGTPSTGANSGVGFFTVQFDSGSPDFPTRIGTGAVSTFDTAGSGPNSGFTVTTPTNDLGASGPGRPAPFANVTAVFLQFTVAGNTPEGVYNFRATLGDSSDDSFINVNNPAQNQSDSFDVNNAPIFTVTVVPEPSTWALMATVGVGAFAWRALRARQKV